MTVYHESQVPWPAGRAETADRKNGPFQTNMANACDRIEKQVEMFSRSTWRTTELWIYADADSGAKGRFLSNQRGIRDPKVAVSFDLDGTQYNIVADRYFEPWQNLAGIASYIEAIRAQERNGIFTAQEMMASFAALPAPPRKRDWFEVLAVSPSAPREVIDASYKALAKKLHPDVQGGSTEAFQELQGAYEDAKEAAK